MAKDKQNQNHRRPHRNGDRRKSLGQGKAELASEHGDPVTVTGPIPLSVIAVAKKLGIGRTTVYAMLRDGTLSAVKLRARTLILASEVDALLARLPKF